MQLSAEYAQDHFAELLTASGGGEEVEIHREKKPAYRLALVPEAKAEQVKQPGPWGVDAGEIGFRRTGILPR